MKFSLNKKAILLIVCIAAVISILAVLIYSKGIRDVVNSQYEDRSIEIAKVASVEIDHKQLANVQKAVRKIYDKADNKVMSDKWGTPEFNAYISRFKSVTEMDDYKALVKDMRRMQDVLDVNCLYTFWLDTKNKCYVYLVDAAKEDPCPPGCIDPLYAENADEILKNPSSAPPTNITNTPEYGWLVSTAIPVKDNKGEVIAFSAVDMSMNEIMSRQNKFLIYVILAFLLVTILVCIVGIILVNRFIVKPINKLSEAASQYKHNEKVFSELNISRSDEIGTLAESMVQMESDIDGYISDLISAREHADQMDRAANIDALTKVRNKRAYDIEAQRLNDSTQPYGIVMIDLNGLKVINDTHGHEKGDISINTLCQIICRVFKHSPVFRVGGDEFIVILENTDYEERDELIRSIKDIFRQNAEDTSVPPWEGVTAAVGCAVHAPVTDERVEAVLQRADTAMYENKKEMKDGRTESES